MKVKTKIFEFYDREYQNLIELGQAMGISVSQLHDVREGSGCINRKFIIGAKKAFPEYNLGDLFYLAPESPSLPGAEIGSFSKREHSEYSPSLKA